MAVRTGKPKQKAVPQILSGTGEDNKPTKRHDGAEERIRRLAYMKWEAAGRPDGDGMSFWLKAERELTQA